MSSFVWTRFFAVMTFCVCGGLLAGRLIRTGHLGEGLLVLAMTLAAHTQFCLAHGSKTP